MNIYDKTSQGQTTTPQPVSPRTLQIPSSLEDLNHVISHLEKQVEELYGRLNPLMSLAPVAGGEGGGGDEPKKSLAGLAEAYGAQTDRLRRLNGVLSNIHSRLEI